MTNYANLHPEDSWIEYLRTRVPYSFKRIEERGGGNTRRFVLFDPEPNLGADYHNFWRRGNIYYVSALMLDRADLSYFWQLQITLEEWGHLRDARSRGLSTPDVHTQPFYNMMQVEKVWRFATEDHLDRERVVMTNCMQALELCLKAIQTPCGVS